MKKVSVKITEIDLTNKLAILKTIMSAIGIGQKEAMDITDSLPGVVQSNLYQEEAQELVDKLSDKFNENFGPSFDVSFAIVSENYIDHY